MPLYAITILVLLITLSLIVVVAGVMKPDEDGDSVSDMIGGEKK